MPMTAIGTTAIGGDRDRRYRDDDDDGRYRKRRKRDSFLSDLFDFD